jgi:hypothetical protein
MSRRQLLIVVLVGLIGLGAGAFVAYSLSQERARDLDRQRLDLMQAIRGVDLQNRLAMLRLLRENKVSQEDIRSLEISAILLLDTIDLKAPTTESQSLPVLQGVSKRMLEYRGDFPNSEFEPSRHKSVERLLSLSRT